MWACFCERLQANLLKGELLHPDRCALASTGYEDLSSSLSLTALNHRSFSVFVSLCECKTVEKPSLRSHMQLPVRDSIGQISMGTVILLKHTEAGRVRNLLQLVAANDALPGRTIKE